MLSREDSHSHASISSTPRSTSSIMQFYQRPTDIIRTNISPTTTRSLELKLIHHFTAVTSQTFSDTKEQKQAWQVEIPTIAYEANYLMDAILAVSALHLRSSNPGDQNLIRASHGYMASALAQYSSLLNSGLCEYNAEALFSTSALIAFQASASRRFEDDQGDGGYSLPLAWFHSFQGVKTVVMASWQWLRTSSRVYPIINGQPAIYLDMDPGGMSFFAPLLENLSEQLESLDESTRAETKQAYEHAVAFLNWAHRRPIRNRILGFAATVSRRFVELIGEHDPRALVIVACFFALTKMVDDVWWLQGIAKREVNGIFGLLPQEWWPKMEWPLRIANHEGPIDDDTWGIKLAEAGVKMEEEAGTVHSHIDMLAHIMNQCTDTIPLD